ncbi:sortase [Streptomyces sp. NBC_01525]|uniref:Class F sortase n=1 Tax=Streptomyces benahoarensis TaxID=2595054 RepID=A0A553Y709_9ACTN|nr:sortase [Streptomyces benahoarensis]TSB18748.1 class F sortase [Streptomyces benahoarensis]TSB24995.1 class F sortase [Streptomyces benahoarensis]
MSGAPGTAGERRRRSRGRTGNGTVVLALAAVGAGGWLIAVGARATAPQRPPAAPGLGGPAARTGARDAAPLPPSPPVRVRVPAAGIDAPLTGLGHDARGALREPPADRPGLAGWDRDGVPPGSPGTAVVTGRAAATAGPAAFRGLAALPPGGTVEVRRADGRTALFTVDAVAPHERDAVLDDITHDAAARPELRLLTCGDAERGVVVSAHLTGAG